MSSLRRRVIKLLLPIYRVFFSSSQTLSLEEQLLTLLLASNTEEATLEATRRLLRQRVNWDALIELAQNHRVAAIVYLRLRDCFAPFVPPEVMAHFDQYYQAHQWYTLHTMSDTMKTLRLLENNDIPVLPFKGPAVALTLYDNPYERRYKDVDLLIHKRDFERATQLLLQNGYTHADWVDEPMKISSEFYESQHMTFMRVEQRVQAVTQLELHWSLATSFEPFEQDEARFWSRTSPMKVGSFEFLGLPPDETLILLCIHGSKHLWAGLHWVYDIAQFVRHYPALDWDAVLAEAHRRRMRRLVLVSLLIAHHVTNVTLPSVVSRAADADPVAGILARYNAQLIFDPKQSDTLLGQMRIILFHALLRETWHDKFSYYSYVIQHRRSAAARRLFMALLVLIFVLLYILVRQM